MNRFRSAPLMAALAALLGLLVSLSPPPAWARTSVALRVEWIDPDIGNRILVGGVLVGAHNGEADFYDYLRPLPAVLVEPFERLMRAGVGSTLVSTVTQTYGGVFSTIYTLPFPRIFGVPPPWVAQESPIRIDVDPFEHRYFSFLGSVRPADDAFFGNEDPVRYPLFDEQGRFLGPLLINIYGNEVMDAGLCANTETGLDLLDPRPSHLPCRDGEGIVAPHPGLNGSLRNPDGEPQRILGSSFRQDGITVTYGQDTADFSRPGYLVGRLLVTNMNRLDKHLVGSWYNPERAGEGFNIDILEPATPGGPPRIMVYWYTFEPNGNGKPVWLSGMADVYGGITRVPLHRTWGGRFASTDNPTRVERVPWGHVDLDFWSCFDGMVRYTPVETGWPQGEYMIRRLGPLPATAAELCAAQQAP